MAEPVDGTSISGRSYNVTVSSSDDHQVTKIELSSTMPSTHSHDVSDGVGYNCQLFYRGPSAGSTAAFGDLRSYDWLGNVGTLTTTFNVN